MRRLGALDNESERVVQQSLERLIENRTTLVIAHRLSTIRNADRILVLTEEGICEQGTHEQLIADEGAYAGNSIICSWRADDRKVGL